MELAKQKMKMRYNIFITNLKKYAFIGANIIKITLPDYLKSGYYNINGAGIFRYIAEGDTYDSSTNFNEPIIEVDDNGNVRLF